MNISQHCHFTWKIAVIIVGYSVILPLCWAQGHRTKSVPSELALNVSSKDPESPERVMEPNFALIEQVQATDFGQHVQVRVVGSGALSCTPFQLTDPDRLVLDCKGAHVRVGSTRSRVDLDPVLSVRVGQFKTNVARVVVELAARTPYTVRAEGNVVVVTLDSIHRRTPSFESNSKQIDSPASPVKGQGDQMASALILTVPDKLPVPKRVEVTSEGPSRTEASPTNQSASTATPAQPPPQMASEPVGIPLAISGSNTSAEKLDSIPPDQDYVVGPQDLLAINVWQEAELSRSVPVRPDGKISMPLVGEFKASGLTPRLLQTQLAKALEAYIRNPQVTVIIQEANSHKFYIIGEVQHPGTYPLTSHLTVLNALATGGGFRDFAKVNQIYLLRLMPDGSRKRLHFDYKAAVNGKNSYQDLELQTGDTLVVP